MKTLLNFTQLMGLALAGAGNGNRYANASGEMMLLQPSLSGYTGAGDPGIEITGAVQDFRQEGHLDKRFGVTINNASAEPRTVRLFSGYNTGDAAAAPGQLKDGAFTDITGAAGLSASSTKARKKIASWLRSLVQNPTRVVMIRVSTADQTQMQNEISAEELNEYVIVGSRTFNPSLSINGSTFNVKDVDMVTPDFQISDKSDVLYTINPGTQVTLIFFMGATLDKSKELAVKAAIGTSNTTGYNY